MVPYLDRAAELIVLLGELLRLRLKIADLMKYERERRNELQPLFSWQNGVNYLRQQVRDLLLLFSAFIGLDGELFREIRDLYVCLGEVLNRLVNEFLLLLFNLEGLFRELK